MVVCGRHAVDSLLKNWFAHVGENNMVYGNYGMAIWAESW